MHLIKVLCHFVLIFSQLKAQQHIEKVQIIGGCKQFYKLYGFILILDSLHVMMKH